MKRTARTMALVLALSVLSALFVTGCHSNSGDAKSNDEVNNAMPAQQKAAIAQHKKQADQ